MCATPYRVEGGVPRLTVAGKDVQEIGQRFDYQWSARRRGWFEGADRCYGLDHRAYAAWIHDWLARQRPLAPGERILDAGCGSGEKAAALAQLCPHQSIMGMDVAVSALEQAAAEYAPLGNLDFVQGNILDPPLRWHAFHWGISIGVLHHTPDTRWAFAQFRKLLVDDASVLVWIYPPYQEAPEWSLLYLTRDVLLCGEAPSLPPRLLRPLAFGIIVGFLPLAFASWHVHGKRLSKKLPFVDFSRLTLRQRFQALVFHLFDTLHPRYQFRHSRREVELWFAEEGLDPVFHAHGYYVAQAAPERGARRDAG
jgi:SAM-dependent methyltransferase